MATNHMALGVRPVNCPTCEHPHSSVIDSRPREDSKSIRRRRECIKCGERWTTREVIVQEHKKQVSGDEARAMLNAIQDLLLAVAVANK